MKVNTKYLQYPYNLKYKYKYIYDYISNIQTFTRFKYIVKKIHVALQNIKKSYTTNLKKTKMI